MAEFDPSKIDPQFAAVIANVAMNNTLRKVREAVAHLPPETQMGVLMVGMVTTMRDFLTARKVTDRGRRHRIYKAAVSEFEAKLRHHGNPADKLPAAVEPEKPTDHKL